MLLRSRARRRGWTPLHYVPYHLLAGQPNVIADGAPTAGTVLSISHWPHLPVPAGLEADLSAEMAVRYAAQPLTSRHGSAVAVSNDHFDQDGLVSLYLLTHPEMVGTALADRLVEVARAGDFACCDDPDAARTSMVLAAWAEATRSPLPLPETYAERCELLYRELLQRLPQMVEDVDAYRRWWQEEDEFLARSDNALVTGEVKVTELPELELAVVDLPSELRSGLAHRFAQLATWPLHPLALHRHTGAFTLLLLQGRRYRVHYRYETWVQYRSRRPRPRVDLTPLAARLNRSEDSGGRWRFDGVAKLTPTLELTGAADSTWAPDTFVDAVCRFLEQAPPAWDPYQV